MASAANNMGQVRVGGAIGGALFLIVRRPFSMLAWGLITTLAAFAPISVIALTILPGARAAADAAAMAGQVTASTMALIQGAAALVLAALLLIVVAAVVDAAVFRAVLEPKNRGVFYLKVRRRELGLVGHFLAQAVLWGSLIAVAAVPIAWVIGFTANSLGRSTAVLISILCGLVAAYLFAVFGVRMFLAGPITFDRGEVGIASSWRATRDRFGPIFAVAILAFVLVWLLTFLLYAFGHLTLASAAAEWVSNIDPVRRLELVAILSLYFGIGRVLAAAPGVLICRQLSPAVASIAADTAPAPASSTRRQPLSLA